MKTNKIGEGIKKSILYNFVLKVMGVGISFLILPLTINYLNKLEYGIWVTLFSIMNWVNFLDMGIGLGMRNKLAEAVEINNTQEIKEYISTGFITIQGIGMVVFLIFYITIQFVPLQRIFNTKEIGETDLYLLVLLTGGFVVFVFVFSTINQIYYAYQKAEIVGLIQIVHNLFMLGIILFLFMLKERRLLYYVLSFGVAAILSKITFIIFFFRSRKSLIPRIAYVKLRKIREISRLGIKFFIIQISCIFCFSSSNILITQLLGPEYVREYDVIFKIFNFLTMIHSLILTPLWSAYTCAYLKGEMMWIKRTLKNTNLIVFALFIAAIVFCLNIDSIIEFWIGFNMEQSNTFVVLVAIYTVLLMWNNNYAYLLNGIGKINVQLIGWVSGAILVIPLSVVFTKVYDMNIEGIILSLIFCLSINAIITPMHVYKILNKSNKGQYEDKES